MNLTKDNYVEEAKNAASDIQQVSEETYEQFMNYIEELRNVSERLQALLADVDKIDTEQISDIEKQDWFEEVSDSDIEDYYIAWNSYSESISDTMELSADLNETITMLEDITEKY